MMKMKDGVANTDLITALYIAKETDSEVKQLLQMRKTISWQEIVRPLLENPTLPKTKDTLSFIQKSNSDD